MKTEQLQAIKGRLTNVPDGWTISQGNKLIEQLSFDGIALVAEVERLQAEVARYKEGYEICNSGMYRAFCWYKDAQAQLDRTELAEAKARMENERLCEMLKGARQSYNRKRKEAKALANACRNHKVENERLRDALEEYAAAENHERAMFDPEVYENGYVQSMWEPSWVELDKGELARKALAGESA